MSIDTLKILKDYPVRRKLYDFLMQEFIASADLTDVKAQQYTLKVSSGVHIRSPVEALVIRREALQFMLDELKKFNIPVETLHCDLLSGCILGHEKDAVMNSILELYLWKNESIKSISAQTGITRRSIYFYKDKLLIIAERYIKSNVQTLEKMI